MRLSFIQNSELTLVRRSTVWLLSHRTQSFWFQRVVAVLHADRVPETVPISFTQTTRTTSGCHGGPCAILMIGKSVGYG